MIDSVEGLADELKRSEKMMNDLHKYIYKKLQLTGNIVKDFAKISVKLFEGEDNKNLEEFAEYLIKLIEIGIGEESGKDGISQIRDIFEKWIGRAIKRELLKTINGNDSSKEEMENNGNVTKASTQNKFEGAFIIYR